MNTQEAHKAEYYDETEEIQVSSMMTGAEAANVSMSNANDNGDGGYTPPPLQDDEQVKSECEDLNYHIVLNANECQKEKFSPKMDIISRENHSMVIPDDPKELDNFIKMGTAAIDAAKEILKKSSLCVKEYLALHQKAKENAFIVLNAALKLSVAIKNIETHKGNRSDLHPDQYRSKEKILEEDFGLTQKQARRLASLTIEAIDKEKKFANDNDEIPTITHALKCFTGKNAKQKETPTRAFDNICDDEDMPATQNERYDIIYADINQFDNNFDLSQVANDNTLFYVWANKSQLEAVIKIMNDHNFEYVDCSVFIREKSEKGGKYFQDMHQMILLGKKGNPKPPFTYKANSVAYANEIGENNGYSYYDALIKRMYPNATVLNLINIEEAKASSEEVANAE